MGVMSGTSLDGIDLVHISLEIDDKWKFKIYNSETVSYSNYWKEKLSSLVHLNMEKLEVIDQEYTRYLSEVINDFLLKYQIKTVDAICSHGHTALHQPEHNLTYQIGNLPLLAKLTKHTVVCDFRTQDVKLNGQGAPLVPIGDRLLFSEYDYCINLGGFANMSYELKTKRIAYDICPVNIVMNQYANRLGLDFDKSGAIAKSGKLNQKILDALNNLNYYTLRPPKSLGLEWVNEHVLPILESSKLNVADILRTFVEHAAIQISKVIASKSKVLFTGGGTYNTFLLERINAQKELRIIVPSNTIIDYKEALIFGLLGVLKLRDEINCLSSVTGANYDHSSGHIYYV